MKETEYRSIFPVLPHSSVLRSDEVVCSAASFAPSLLSSTASSIPVSIWYLLYATYDDKATATRHMFQLFSVM